MKPELSDKETIVGDIHNGRAVLSVEDGDRRYILKPRNANTELAYKAFLSDVEEKGFIYRPGVVNILKNSEKEHVVSVVEHIPVSTEKEVHLFYRRCGSLLLLAYIFASKDLHYENIIASGGYPTIVDYEMLMSGVNKGYISDSVKTLKETVLESQLLPHWSLNEEDDVDLGGLTAAVITKKEYRSIKGSDIYSATEVSKNVQFWNDQPTFAYEYIEDIILGFENAYEMVAKNKETTIKGIHLFDECTFRVLLRPTKVYANISLLLMRYAKEEREEIARFLLERAYRNSDVNFSKIQETLNEEIRAVVEGEIPLFSTKGNDHSLYCQQQLLQTDYLELSPVENVIKRIETLSEEVKNSQISIIKQSISATRPIDKKEKHNINGTIELLQFLDKNAIEGISSKWMYLTRGKRGNLFLQSIGFGEYNGLIGVLCFYSAIYAKTRNEKIWDILFKYYYSYRELAIPSKLQLTDMYCSLSSGLGGHLLALMHMAELTDNNIFLDDAYAMLEAVVIPDDITSGNCDVLGGYAGLLLALPNASCPKSCALSHKLLPKLLEYTPELTGMGHGAAGVALALGKASVFVEQKALKQQIESKIIELLLWENAYYSEEMGNWADLRNDGKGYMFGWCSGAPGIGIARKELLKYTENAQIRKICSEDIKRVQSSIQKRDPLTIDCLCCGNAAVLMAASRLGINKDVLYNRMKAALKSGEISLNHIADTCDFIPGLMQGYAGVGYALAMYGDERCGDMLV